MAALITAARYLWAAPNTVLGLTLWPVVLLTGGRAQVHGGVLELYGGILESVLDRCVPVDGGAAAMTLGHVVIARDRLLLDLSRRHERVHVRQCECWGPLFIPAYFLASLWAAVKGQGAYHGNYFELQARRLENE
jgi:hypothetical protein